MVGARAGHLIKRGLVTRRRPGGLRNVWFCPPRNPPQTAGLLLTVDLQASQHATPCENHARVTSFRLRAQLWKDSGKLRSRPPDSLADLADMAESLLAGFPLLAGRGDPLRQREPPHAPLRLREWTASSYFPRPDGQVALRFGWVQSTPPTLSASVAFVRTIRSPRPIRPFRSASAAAALRSPPSIVSQRRFPLFSGSRPVG